jgi:hypothetical protein
MRVTFFALFLSTIFIIEAFIQRSDSGAASPFVLLGATFGMLYLMASALHVVLHLKTYKSKIIYDRRRKV